MNEDIFNRLLDVEQDAGNMVFEAQIEADDKIANEKKEIDEKYRFSRDRIVEEMENVFVEQKKMIDDSAEKEISSYKRGLISIKPDFVTFNKVLDSYFCLEVASTNAQSNN